MHTLLGLIFSAILFALQTIIPSWFLTAAGRMQQEFDLFLLQPETCRSDYRETRMRSFLFTSGHHVSCPARRGDYAAPGSRNSWPYAICALLDTSDQAIAEKGKSQCDYQ